MSEIGGYQTLLIRSNSAAVQVLEEVKSTSDVAKERLFNGAPHMSAVVANVQTNGRGRLNRKWRTFEGTSIAVSFVVRQGVLPQLPLAVSLAAARTMEAFGSVDCDIKWPNDLLIGGKKVAGVLVETLANPADNGQLSAIVGVGINVNKPKEKLPQTFDGTWLEAALGAPVPRENVLSELISQIEDVTAQLSRGSWAALRAFYVNKCMVLGEKVVWENGGKKITAIAERLLDDGTLELRDSSGKVHQVHAGDIILQGAGTQPAVERE